jgi:hypothetical protein
MKQAISHHANTPHSGFRGWFSLVSTSEGLVIDNRKNQENQVGQQEEIIQFHPNSRRGLLVLQLVQIQHHSKHKQSP